MRHCALSYSAALQVANLVLIAQENKRWEGEPYLIGIGSDSYNLDLSRRRAEAVRDFLIDRGVGPARITARGYGEAYPVAPNDTATGCQQNRRVEVVVLR